MAKNRTRLNKKKENYKVAGHAAEKHGFLVFECNERH